MHAPRFAVGWENRNTVCLCVWAVGSEMDGRIVGVLRTDAAIMLRFHQLGNTMPLSVVFELVAHLCSPESYK